MARKGNRISVVTVSIVVFLVLIQSYLVYILLGWDLNFLFQKMQSMLLGKGIHFLFNRLGWCVGGLIFAIFCSLFDPESMSSMMGPSAPSGDSGSESSEWRKYLNIPSDIEVTQTPGHQAPPAPDGQSSSASYDGDSFAIDVLLESWPATTETEAGTSVNQPEAGLGPPANPVAPPGGEAGPPNQPPQVVPYPYQENEIIGGDCVEFIQRRLLGRFSSPSAHDIQMARIQAEDLFEVKVDIIRVMAGLDPTGDWMGRGARALDNPRTSTGEESLDRLYAKWEALNRDGVRSDTFVELKDKLIYKRLDEPENSSA